MYFVRGSFYPTAFRLRIHGVQTSLVTHNSPLYQSVDPFTYYKNETCLMQNDFGDAQIAMEYKSVGTQESTVYGIP